jgi:hypothetical protein
MGWFFIIFGILILLATIKTKPKTEKEAENQEKILKHKNKFRIIGTFFILIGLAIIFSTGEQKKPSTAVSEDFLQKFKENYSANPSARGVIEVSEDEGTEIKSKVIRIFSIPKTVLGSHIASIIYEEYKHKKHKDALDFPTWPNHISIFIMCNQEKRIGKECLSDEDKDGTAVLETVYKTLNLKNPSMEDFKNLVRQCTIDDCHSKIPVNIVRNDTIENKEQNMSLKNIKALVTLNKINNTPEYLMIIYAEQVNSIPSDVHFEIYNYKDTIEYDKKLKQK